MSELAAPVVDNTWFSKMHAVLGLVGGSLGIVAACGLIHNQGVCNLLSGLSVLLMGGGVLGARGWSAPVKP